MSTAVRRLLPLAVLLLALVVTPATASAATLSGTRVRASAFSAPLRTGTPSSLVADRQPENASTYDELAVGVPVATDEGSSLADDLDSVPCGGQSFSATSQVVLASGAAVAISQLRPGAQVLATDPQTGQTQAETVQSVMVNRDTDLMDVVVNTAQSQGTIDSTAHHLFWDLTTRKWTEADQLRTGDRLFTPDGQLATVARLVTLPGAEDMWDLTVANDHDFYVVTVDTAVLVHNCDLLNGTVNANGTLESGANVSRFDAVTSAPDFLGEGSTEIAPSVWRSADGLSQFRMTSIDHANFEMFSDASDKYPIINFHANYTDWP